MTADELRRQLDRIAERAPRVDLARDTWTRARRSVVRDRVLVGAAIVAVTAGIVGAVTWLPSRSVAPADGGLGVPDQLHPVPARMSEMNVENVDDAWVRDQVTSDLDVGVGAAAWLSNRLPVVVDADDGNYHLLNLPGYGGNNFFNQLEPATIALSPDGSRLAYSWASFGADAASEPIPSGVRIADLTTGDVVEFAIEGLEGTAVTRIAWSADGGWVAFVGQQMGSWTTQSSASGDGKPIVGRVDLDSARVETLPDTRFGDASVGVDDDGVVAIGTDARLRYWDGSTITSAPVATARDRWLVASAKGAWALPGQGVVTVVDGEEVHEVRLRNSGGQSTRPLGWVGGDIAVSVDEDQGWDAVELVAGDGGSSRKVVDLEDVDVHSLSIAVGLLAGDDPTVSRPEPSWPMSDERKVAIGVVLGLLLVALVSWLWARRRWLRVTRS